MVAKLPLSIIDYSRDVAEEPDIVLLNRFYEADPQNTDNQVGLIVRSGLRKWLSVGVGPIRAVYDQPGTFGEAVFTVSGAGVYKIAQNETVTHIGDLSTSTGKVSMTATGTYLFIADGTDLHYYVEDDYARGTLTSTGSTSAAETVVIGSIHYEFASDVTTGTPDGTSANPWLVFLGGSTEEALANLEAAIGDTGNPGTDYSLALTPNPDVTATSSDATTLKVRANLNGTSGNSTATTETMANASWGAATLAGGGGSTFGTVSVPDGDGIISVGEIISFVICVVAQGHGKNGRFYWIRPGEMTIDPLDFATAEKAPDPVWEVIPTGDGFWLPGPKSVERWVPSGDGDAPFQRQQGIVFEQGIWEGTIAPMKEGVVLIGTDGMPYYITDRPYPMGTAGIVQRIREAMDSQRGSEPSTSPYDTTPRVSIDFKDAVYSIGGVSKTLDDCVEHNTDVGAYSDSDVSAGTGLLASGTTTNTLPALTSAAFAAATAGGTSGFSVVLSVVLTGTSTHFAKALVSYAPTDESTAYEGFAENLNGDDSSSVYDYSSQEQDFDALATLAKVGFTFTPSKLSMCVDGGSVASTGTPQSNTAAMIYMQAKIGGSGATAVIQKAEFFAPAPTDADLQGLTS